ncbi:TfoX/Sxy family protein [Pseudorhodobacter sp.]|uniref:TfoX/Sxy family protein n=1 Tax=Pseudorhodobacter sp. TaxID=1934400 RepID=UPI002649FEDA|nr:TfoX/Sxy family protein [Pseudorhodobacter sp.]MDN5786951.1 TfoX/Sxy family protein [Pseudorhodobacter sp.]
MAYNEDALQLLRNDLAALPVVEKKMFGALCFMLHGNMLCGAQPNGALFRTSPDDYATALAIAGASPMCMGKDRQMKGFVECDMDALQDDTQRAAFLSLSLSFVNSLPPK